MSADTTPSRDTESRGSLWLGGGGGGKVIGAIMGGVGDRGRGGGLRGEGGLRVLSVVPRWSDVPQTPKPQNRTEPQPLAPKQIVIPTIHQTTAPQTF
jgi:hypothetical protein